MSWRKRVLNHADKHPEEMVDLLNPYVELPEQLFG
jgi:hypothetical protein